MSAIITAGAAACSSSGGTATASGSGASSGPVKIGMITALTGALAGERTTDVTVTKALVSSVNAAGGINGHQLVLDVEDDQSTPAGALVASQALVRDGVVGIDFDDATIEGGPAQYLHQQGIPVTGLGSSPSWLADANMFGVTGYGGTGTEGTTTVGLIEKRLGVSKFVGVSYGQVPASILNVTQVTQGAASVGVSSAANIGIALSGQNFTSTALQVKSLGAQGVYTAVSSNDNISLVTALSQEGLKLPGILLPTGYEQSTLQTTTAAAANGAYFTSSTAPADLNTGGVQTYHEMLTKYAPGVFAGTQEGFAYLEADLLVAGLKADDGSSSRSSLLSAIAHITSFSGGGVSAETIDFTKPKADEPIQGCLYVISLKDGKFSSLQQTPVCGTAVKS